ncbi:unnamed protein product [Symbiodinium sp. CCMP2456]|nr:unnamed protein product [Symbiodinium sp. CCMP2456]
MALPMREDVDSLKVFRNLLEKERLLSTRWNKQVDYSAWRIPSHSHHESFLKPGDGVRLTVSRSHPELNGASGTVLCVDRPSDGGFVTVRMAPVSGSMKKLKVRPSLLLPGRSTNGPLPSFEASASNATESMMRRTWH